MPEVLTAEQHPGNLKTAATRGAGTPLIGKDRISRRAHRPGREISPTYEGTDTPLVLVVILTGATVLAAGGEGTARDLRLGLVRPRPTWARKASRVDLPPAMGRKLSRCRPAHLAWAEPRRLCLVHVVQPYHVALVRPSRVVARGIAVH